MPVQIGRGEIMTSASLLLDNPITMAIKAIYGIAKDFEEGFKDLIEVMKRSENVAIARTGSVIEGARYGFGIGYVTPVIIIAVGQFILGNPLHAAMTVGSAAVLSNPIAMTCGAIGAIYYGWQALDHDERNAILNRVMEAFQVGAELVKAMVNFVITTTKELLSSESLAEVKKMLASVANGFGKKLGDITGAITDGVRDTVETVADKVVEARDYVAEKFSRNGKQADPPQVENG
jgi:hypothetical protein